MDLSVASSGRAVTIDRARKARIRRDAVLQTISSPTGQRPMVFAALATGVLGRAVDGWLVAAIMFIIGGLGQLGWWWLRTNASLRSGLDVGQTVRVGYASSGEISITDSTGQIWLPRGSVFAVVRYRGNLTVVGRQVAFLLPRELLTQDDIAFLEGHGPAPQDPTTQGPELPLSCEITARTQGQLVAAATRIVVRSADFLMLWFSAALVVSFVSLAGSIRAVAVTVALCALLVLPGLRGVLRTRAQMRATYRIGLTVRANVTDEGLLLSLAHGTRTLPWRDFSAARLTTNAVLLRRSRRVLAQDKTVILPKALLDNSSLTTIAAAVSGRR